MVNKKGQVLFYAFMLGLVIIVLALALAGPVRTFTDDARDSDGLNCSNPAIDDYTNAGCIATDLTLFYFIGALIFIGFAIWRAKIVFA